MSTYQSLINASLRNAAALASAGAEKTASAGSSSTEALLKEASEVADALEYMAIAGADDGTNVGAARAELVQNYFKTASRHRSGLAHGSSSSTGKAPVVPQKGRMGLANSGKQLQVTSASNSYGDQMRESFKQASLEDIFMGKVAGDPRVYSATEYTNTTNNNENAARHVLNSESSMVSAQRRTVHNEAIRKRLAEAFANTNDTLSDQTAARIFPNAYAKGGLKKTASDVAARTRARLEKVAVIGPLADIGNLGIPSGIGYAMGSNHDFVDAEDAQDYLDDGPSIAGTLLMPGYLGYGAGKRKKARKMVRRARRKGEKTANFINTVAGRALAGGGAGAAAGGLGGYLTGGDAQSAMMGAGLGAAGGAAAGGLMQRSALKGLGEAETSADDLGRYFANQANPKALEKAQAKVESAQDALAAMKKDPSQASTGHLWWKRTGNDAIERQEKLLRRAQQNQAIQQLGARKTDALEGDALKDWQNRMAKMQDPRAAALQEQQNLEKAQALANNGWAGQAGVALPAAAIGGLGIGALAGGGPKEASSTPGRKAAFTLRSMNRGFEYA